MKTSIFAHLFMLVLAAILLLGSCATISPINHADVEPGDFASAEKHALAMIETKMREYKIEGMAVSVVSSEKVLMSRGFGWADRDKKRAFDEDTLSNIGSVSKLFTAMAIMKLVEEGKIDLDAPISTYIPEFSIKSWGPSPDGITVRRLLTHHAGIPNDFLDEFKSEVPPADYPRSYNAVIAKLGNSYMTWEPGTAFSYANVGFSLLGVIIERVSGQAFHEYVKENLLLPYGMQSSSFLIEPEYKNRYTLGYEGSKALPIPYIWDLPAGSMNSSARDLSAFMQGILRDWLSPDSSANDSAENRIFKKTSIQDMWAKQNQDAKFDFGFGIGLAWWDWAQLDDGTLSDTHLFGHGGDLPPFRAWLLITPDRGIGVAIMVNSISGGSSNSLQPIATELIRLYTQALGDTSLPPVAKTTQPASQKTPAEYLIALPGSYASGLGLVSIRAEGEQLKASLGGMELDLDYGGDSVFYPRVKFLGIDLQIPSLTSLSFVKEQLVPEPILTIRSWGVTGAVLTVAKKTELNPAWKALLGDYTAIKEDSLIEKITLRYDEKGGYLLGGIASDAASGWFPLQIMDDTHLRVQGYGRNMGVSIEVSQKDGQSYGTFMGIEFKKNN